MHAFVSMHAFLYAANFPAYFHTAFLCILSYILSYMLFSYMPFPYIPSYVLSLARWFRNDILTPTPTLTPPLILILVLDLVLILILILIIFFILYLYL